MMRRRVRRRRLNSSHRLGGLGPPLIGSIQVLLHPNGDVKDHRHLQTTTKRKNPTGIMGNQKKTTTIFGNVINAVQATPPRKVVVEHV